MHPDLVLAARTVDPTVLGTRIKHARLRAGLTQTEAAGEEMSTAYVSRIEAGQRRPDPALLPGLAQRLGVEVEQLVTGVTRDVGVELRTRLSWAHLALGTGDAATALGELEVVRAGLPEGALPQLHHDVAVLRARSLEAAGDVDGAIRALEDLVAQGPHDTTWLGLMTALSRCYRESGDLARAIEVGDRAQNLVEDLALVGSPESVALTVTVAAAHFERGDVGHAARLCQRAIDAAEAMGSPAACASAYWNASIVESRRGNADAALALAERAVALLDQDAEGRAPARLRTQLGILQLRLDPPAPEDALANLDDALESLRLSDASPVDLADNRLASARAHFLLGDLERAEVVARATYDAMSATSPFIAADAAVLLGQLELAHGRAEQARAAFQLASQGLTAVGADRGAAQLWFTLGELLEQVGEAAAALDAYRRAAASTGLRTKTSTLDVGDQAPSA